MRIFLPKQSEFFVLFKEIDDCLTEITDLFYEFSEKYTDFEGYAKKAKEIEKKADSKTHNIIDNLNKTFITPIDREDIYLLAHEFDDVIDLIESVVHYIYVYEVTEKFGAVNEFAVLFKEVAGYLGDLLQCLQKPKYTPEVMDLKIKIHEAEDRGDNIYTKYLKQLFQESNNPVYMMKMKDVLENLENAMDKCQRVSDIIEGIIVKST